MNKILKILFVGALWDGSTALQRMSALKHLGHEIVSLNYAPLIVQKKLYRIDNRIIGKLYRMGLHNFRSPDLACINTQIVESLKNNKFDVIFFDKCMTVDVDTFTLIKSKQPSCILVGFSPDDMFARHNQSRQFLDTISEYDIYFTTKSYGVKELQSLGCKRVSFVGNAYDPETHKPVVISSEDRINFGGEVGFIGSWETDRAQSIYYLAQNGINVRVWGEGWERCKQKHENLRLEMQPLWASDYAKGICSFDINLCFLRKINRDLQTTRSIEIPACGAFMLAERTYEHQSLFLEGVEAEFFSSDDELLDKVRYYLEHKEERLAVGLAGQTRCLISGYSYVDKMKYILNQVSMLSL